MRPNGKLIQLFDPPFDRGVLEPGYIKGYVYDRSFLRPTRKREQLALLRRLQGEGRSARRWWREAASCRPVFDA